MRRVKVAHGMDPTQRAGQTKESNEREAAMYGRSSQVIRSEKNRGKASFFKLLLNLLFTLIFPMMLQGDIVIECILKGLEQQYKEKHSRHSRSSHAASIVR
ncbi:hypothetical protein OC187_01215 [Anaplasma capra]|nr:hypothetical protein [Anaplasma capra]